MKKKRSEVELELGVERLDSTMLYTIRSGRRRASHNNKSRSRVEVDNHSTK